jgi:hypothetical protein
MRALRALVVAVLIAGGVAVLATQASASAPAVSKTCQSLNSLDAKLQKALSSSKSGTVDSGAVSDVSTSFRKAAKSGPGSLKSTMNAIADIARDVSHTSSTAEAAVALKKDTAKLESALAKWGGYIVKNCSA